MAQIFFDQNVIEKMSKKENQDFQKNVNFLLHERAKINDLLLTPFSLLEFCGCNQKDISDIRYKDMKFTEFPFSSYKDFSSKTNYLTENIYKKVTKDFLKKQLESKRIKNKKYLNQDGFHFIDLYIEKIESLYEELIHLLYLEQLSHINTSKFSKEDRIKYINLCSKFVINLSYRFGSFRTVLRIYQEWIKEPLPHEIKKENPELSKDAEQAEKAIRYNVEQAKLKEKGDRLDCDIIHLAFFGKDDKPCHVYTTDSKNLIIHRLRVYCSFMNVITKYYFEHLQNKEKPPIWNCGKVFILNRDTGEKIKKISVTKIYKKIKSKF